VANSGTVPVYFNILSYASHPRRALRSRASDSPAHAMCCYPSQSLAREQLTSLGGDRHFIVMTPCTFELDRLIDEVNRLLADPASDAKADNSLSVYMQTL